MKRKEIKQHFQATDYVINAARKLCVEKGVMSYPSKIIQRKRLDDSVVKTVKEFYQNDDVSRIMPGKMDFVTIWKNGIKCQKQKRLVMGNLKEMFMLFKESYPHISIGFSKFAELRPKQCILAGASGTHTICLCVPHQNFKLLLDCMKNYKIIEKDVSYRDCLSKIICKSPTEDCYLHKCQNCPGVLNFIENIKVVAEEINVISFKYKQWITTDRANLEQLESDNNAFFEKVSWSLTKLLKHSYIADEQSKYFKSTQENLENNECILICDFSENYAFIFQDSIQGVHWNNDTATVHPFVLYVKDNGVVKNVNFVAISNIHTHDAVTFRVFQTKILEHIKAHYSFITKVIYFSDGAVTQYKNKKTL